MRTPANRVAGAAGNVTIARERSQAINATPSFFQAACAYSARGLPVFPLAPGAKIPARGSHGHKDASRDLETVRQWWSAAPRANIAIATGSRSGLWVLDIDPRHDGEDGLLALLDQHGPLPETVSVRTPSGGAHLYWRWPADGRVKNSCGLIAPGIDVLGEGKQITAPPSVLADGRCYEWIRNGAALADAPDWLLRLVAPPPPPPRMVRRLLNTDCTAYGRTALDRELSRLAKAAMGGRNDALNRAAFSLGQLVKADALGEAETVAALLNHAKALGLREAEALATIKSAFAAAQPRQIRGRP